MVNIKISRFSRAKKTESSSPIPSSSQVIEPKIIQPVPEPETEPEPEPTIEIKQDEPTSFDHPQNDDLFDDLNSLNFKPAGAKALVETTSPNEPPPVKEVKTKKDKPFDLSKIISQHKERQPSSFSLDSSSLLDRIKSKSKTTKSSTESYDDTMFSQAGSEILGRDKRVLLTKIRQYKSLFPDTFKTFKIKVNANIQELQTYLTEMDCMVECENVEQFILDSILQCIKLLEGVSSYTKYDIQGLADLLKQNKQFHQLSKQLFDLMLIINIFFN